MPIVLWLERPLVSHKPQFWLLCWFKSMFKSIGIHRYYFFSLSIERNAWKEKPLVYYTPVLSNRRRMASV